MTVFRLATATVLLAGLALPALAQGTAAAVPSAPAMAEHAHTSAAAPASASAASTVSVARSPTVAAATPAGAAAPHAAAATDVGRTGLSPAALPPRAEAGAAEGRDGRAERMVEERAMRSHRRFASEARMERERERAPHDRTRTGEFAPDASR